MDVLIPGLAPATGIIVGSGCVLIKGILRFRSSKLKIININRRTGSRLASLLMKRKELYFCKQEVQIIWTLISLLMNVVMSVCAIKIFVWIIWFKVIRSTSGHFVLKKWISLMWFSKREIGEGKDIA